MSEREDGFYIAFVAMASPCEIIIETVKRSLAKTIGEQVSKEVWRIEDKYSRYNPNSLCSEINRSNNKPVTIP